MSQTSVLSWLVLALLALVACGGPAAGAEAGEECFRAVDCAVGLVCVTGRCTSDLSSTVSTVEGPETAGAAGAP